MTTQPTPHGTYRPILVRGGSLYGDETCDLLIDDGVISAIGTDIWTSIRAMCRAHHVPVVVSNSTQPRCRAGSPPPRAYQIHRRGPGRALLTLRR